MITIYTKPACTQCEFVKATFKNSGVEFVTKPIDNRALNAAKENGWKSAPIVINEDNPELSFGGLDHDKIDETINQL